MYRILLFFFFASFTGAAFAEEWLINKDHSQVQFQIEYLRLAEVNGRFKSFAGKVELENNQVPTKILIKIEAATIDTGNSLRDGHLKANDFLNTNQFSYISFSSHSIHRLSNGSFKAAGDLTIKGITRPSIVFFNLSPTVKDTWSYQSKFVKFNSKIKRNDFNLNWNKTLEEEKYLVGEEVAFNGTFQIQPVLGKTPSNKHMIPDTNYAREREKIVRGEIIAAQSDLKEVLAARPPSIPSRLARPNGAECIPSAPDFRENTWWWVSFWFLGLLGFFAVIMVALFAKNLFAQYFSLKYKENNFLGYLSDLVVIILIVIYSQALWFLGWGIR